MTKRIGAAALAALFLCAPVHAMSAGEFLAKADALKAKGMMAIFSSDLGVLKAEFTADAQAWRAQVTPAGRPPNACPPAAVRMSDEEIYALVAAVPPAQRATTSTRDAVIAGLNRRFPCH
jgi:hypothetical protein